MLDNTSPREPAKVVLDILQVELGLDDPHCIMGDQPWDMPPDKKLFLIARDLDGPVISTCSWLDTTVSPPVEVQQSTVLHDILIEFLSYIDGEARLRKNEIGLAVESIASKQIQELNNCRVDRVFGLVDVSETEATGRLWKYQVHVHVTALHTKTKPATSYFSKFNVAPGSANPPDGTVLPPSEVLNP